MIKTDLRQPRPKALKIRYYAMAVLSVAIATVVTEIAGRLLQAEPVALLMLCAVISVAWLGGFGPALLAIVLALFAFHYDMVPPVNSFAWKHDFLAVDVEQVPRLIVFAITSLIVAFVVTAQRKATEALRLSRDDLQLAIEDQKRVEAALLHSEMHLTEAQRLSRTGSFGWNACTGEIFWTDETFRIFQFDRTTKPSMKCIIERTHPEDRAAVQETIDSASSDAGDNIDC
jgi:K+-sensing histidine kinase KdpD